MDRKETAGVCTGMAGLESWKQLSILRILPSHGNPSFPDFHGKQDNQNEQLRKLYKSLLLLSTFGFDLTETSH